MIVGDANLAEVATFLKVGTTSVVLAMIEDDMLPYKGSTLWGDAPGLGHLSLSRPLRRADGPDITALEIQWEIFAAARRYAKERGLEAIGDEPVGRCPLFVAVLHGLDNVRPPTGLGGQAQPHRG